MAAGYPTDDIVLIVPLWNWNIVYKIDALKKMFGSNRTFMELKYQRASTNFIAIQF